MIYLILIVFSAVLIWGAYGIGRARQWRADLNCMDFDELRDMVGEEKGADVWEYHLQRMMEVSPK